MRRSQTRIRATVSTLGQQASRLASLAQGALTSLPYSAASLGWPLTTNEARLLALRDRHRGQRVFIIGGGPSLKRTDLRLLKDEITIGCNAIFLIFEQMGFLPSYYTVEDVLVAEDRANTINAIRGTTKIFPRDIKYCLRPDQDTVYVNFVRDYNGPPFNFSPDFVRRAFWGGTVTYFNLQLAYYLGCSEVYLIGIDHSYQRPSHGDRVEGTVITSRSTDVNHFHPDYFGPGYRWHDPKLERMQQAYEVAKQFYEANGRLIQNASVRTQLEVFPKVSYQGLFERQDKGSG